MANVAPMLQKKETESQAWYFKPLLREGRFGVYVQKRNGTCTKRSGPLCSLQVLRRNWQGMEKTAETTMTLPLPAKPSWGKVRMLLAPPFSCCLQAEEEGNDPSAHIGKESQP